MNEIKPLLIKAHTRKMEDRKEREHKEKQQTEKARLKALLSPNRKDHKSYFKEEVRDRRYTGQSFSQFLTREEKEGIDRTLVKISRKKIEELVSIDFRTFIVSKCWRSFFLLPSADYVLLEKMPCLNFIFDIFAVVEAGVWLEPRQKNSSNYVLNLPLRKENGRFVPSEETEFLGYHYLVLTPQDLGHSVWQSIPLRLIAGLFNGGEKAVDVTILAASADIVTYGVQGFKEEVDVPDKFADYLKTIGSIDGMVNIGIITEKIANIVKDQLAKLKKEQSALSTIGSAIDKNT